jgi:MoaA/NifB/PqqE/SkfB family radical SAM enzyme
MSRQSPQTVQFSAGERNIFLHLLTACNLNCSHCYIAPHAHGRRPLSRTTLMNWLRLFYDPARRNHLILLGGEPTLHKHLPEAIHTANRIGYTSVTVDTNGYCFNQILEKVPPDQAVFSFSLDGPDPGSNDDLRGPDSFQTCVANIKRAVALGFNTSVITTVSRRNIAHLPEMPSLLADLGVDRFFIQVIGLRGKAAGQGEDLQLSPGEWLETVPVVARRAAECGMTAIYPKVYLAPQESFVCAGNVADNFFIFPNGRVYRCPLCEDLPIHSLVVEENRLRATQGLTERQLFGLSIPEGCVMNKLLQPDNIPYDAAGKPLKRISCCLLKERIDPT